MIQTEVDMNKEPVSAVCSGNSSSGFVLIGNRGQSFGSDSTFTDLMGVLSIRTFALCNPYTYMISNPSEVINLEEKLLKTEQL